MLNLDAFAYVRDERLRLLLAHWLKIRKGRLIPPRAELDPVALKPVLPFLWICDYDREAGTLRYRLAGEAINAVYGGNLRGISMETMFSPETRPDVMARMLGVVQDGAVFHAIGDIYSTRMRTGAGERLILPLASDGRLPDAMVGATVYDWGDAGSESLARQQMTVRYAPVDGREADSEPRNVVVSWGGTAPVELLAQR